MKSRKAQAAPRNRVTSKSDSPIRHAKEIANTRSKVMLCCRVSTTAQSFAGQRFVAEVELACRQIFVLGFVGQKQNGSERAWRRSVREKAVELGLTNIVFLTPSRVIRGKAFAPNRGDFARPTPDELERLGDDFEGLNIFTIRRPDLSLAKDQACLTRCGEVWKVVEYLCQRRLGRKPKEVIPKKEIRRLLYKLVCRLKFEALWGYDKVADRFHLPKQTVVRWIRKYIREHKEEIIQSIIL